MLPPQSEFAQTAEVFAELGCWSTTIQKICSRVRACVAAVHYDFGCEEELPAAGFEFALKGANQSPADHLARGIVGRPA